MPHRFRSLFSKNIKTCFNTLPQIHFRSSTIISRLRSCFSESLSGHWGQTITTSVGDVQARLYDWLATSVTCARLSFRRDRQLSTWRVSTATRQNCPTGNRWSSLPSELRKYVMWSGVIELSRKPCTPSCWRYLNLYKVRVKMWKNVEIPIPGSFADCISSVYSTHNGLQVCKVTT